MEVARTIAFSLIEEGTKARAHFQIWWTLRNLAIPEYLPAMNELSYVDFFHAANAGHYTLFLLALAKIFDRDRRVAGIKELKQALRGANNGAVAEEVEKNLKPYESRITKIMHIRNRSVVHNEHAIPRNKVYEINGITPNEIREVIDAVSESINRAASALDISHRVFDSDRMERATLNMLKALDTAKSAR